MQALCGLQGIFDLFNCKTPESEQLRRNLIKKSKLFLTLLEENGTIKIHQIINHRDFAWI